MDAAWPSPVVCERSGRWAAAIRRTAVERGLAAFVVVEVRSLVELRQRLVDERRNGRRLGPVVVELSLGDERRVASFLDWYVRFGDDAPTAVVTTDAEEYEEIVRAAGANLFVSSPREVGPIVEVYVAFAADKARHRPRPEDETPSPTEKIWNELPFT